MRMLNQAFEDAAAFEAFRDSLTRRSGNAVEIEPQQAPPKHDGESRQQYRARVRAERKAATRKAVKS